MTALFGFGGKLVGHLQGNRLVSIHGNEYQMIDSELISDDGECFGRFENGMIFNAYHEPQASIEQDWETK